MASDVDRLLDELLTSDEEVGRLSCDTLITCILGVSHLHKLIRLFEAPDYDPAMV